MLRAKIPRIVASSSVSVVDVKADAAMVGRTVLLALLWLAIVLLAGCETTHNRTARAAEGLEYRADAFAAHACSGPNAVCASSQLPTARQFSEQVREFRSTLDNAGDQSVVVAFQGLWRSYRLLRDDVYHLRDDQLRADFKSVTQAFVDVQIQVKNGYSYADPAVYASGGYLLEPYYN
jgi:hypothetical protein